MNFIKIICNSFEERDFIHKQGCIVNERKCKGRYGYDIEFKCKNKKEVLQVIDQLAKDFEKEKHTVIKK